ncbi:MAG: class I SAM-dependent methyltransferase [archaeon]
MTWDQFNETTPLAVPHEYLETFLEKVGTGRLLDLGCGTGRHLLPMLTRGFETHGLDSSAVAIHASAKIGAMLVQHNMYEALPYPDNYFDGIIAIQSIYHAARQLVRCVANEVHRICKPEGLFFVNFTTYVPDDARWINPYTFIPQVGTEKGIPHTKYNSAALQEDFCLFYFEQDWMDAFNHRCLLLRKK